MKTIEVLNSKTNELLGWLVFCPACKQGHVFDSRWIFNGDKEKPTFHGSMLVRIPYQNKPAIVCHSFITEGKIQFLPDCTHSLRGQTVDLIDFDSFDETVRSN